MFVYSGDKNENIDSQIIQLICPLSSCDYSVCPSVGAYGGILLVRNDDFWHKLDEFVGRFFVFVLMHDVRHNIE